MSDTPRTDALLTELAVVKHTTFAQIVRDTNRHVALTRELERENNMLRLKIDTLTNPFSDE